MKNDEERRRTGTQRKQAGDGDIDRKLRQTYEAIAKEPVPEAFLRLLEELADGASGVRPVNPASGGGKKVAGD